MKGSDDKPASQMPLGLAGLPRERIVSRRHVRRVLSFSQSSIKLPVVLGQRNEAKNII
jgi:hypothetical protein